MTKRASGRSRMAAKDRGQAPVSRGPVVTAVSRLVDGLAIPDGAHRRLALGALAVTLAGQLDGDAGMATAAVSKELRATLAELEGEDAGDDDAFAQWERDLGAPT